MNPKLIGVIVLIVASLVSKVLYFLVTVVVAGALWVLEPDGENLKYLINPNRYDAQLYSNRR